MAPLKIVAIVKKSVAIPITAWCRCRQYFIRKGKPEKTQGRKATDPRFLPDASCDAFKDPKLASSDGNTRGKLSCVMTAPVNPSYSATLR